MRVQTVYERDSCVGGVDTRARSDCRTRAYGVSERPNEMYTAVPRQTVRRAVRSHECCSMSCLCHRTDYRFIVHYEFIAFTINYAKPS